MRKVLVCKYKSTE